MFVGYGGRTGCQKGVAVIGLGERGSMIVVIVAVGVVLFVVGRAFVVGDLPGEAEMHHHVAWRYLPSSWVLQICY